MNTGLSRIASYDALSRYSHWIIADAMIGMKPSGHVSIFRSLESPAHYRDRIFLG
ncbi:hypothetical protein [Roseibium album]|uniref:hypothetical protein n=1 Tax=Roseibium album TaxID=311410 RepID=UPI002490B0AA|nr:hypothetical protein [Roseibium album]